MKLSFTLLVFVFTMSIFGQNKNVAIIDITPAQYRYSALLGVYSETQGFLPPRMTTEQRDAIASPAAGLLIWCNDCAAAGEIQVYSVSAGWTAASGVSAMPVIPEVSEVVIGTQTWSSRNLDVTTYRDGTAIPQVIDHSVHAYMKFGGWRYYNDLNRYGFTYGKLYNYYAVYGITTPESDPPTAVQIAARKNIAPVGWHVPSIAEWDVLEEYLGGVAVAGDKLKEVGNAHWITTNTGTDDYGFRALPGGFSYAAYPFRYLGFAGYWWLSSPDYQPWEFTIADTRGSAASRRASQTFRSNSVRLIKD